MNDHDKFDCHIIKEMIINNRLSIDYLSQKELDILIDYEMDIIAESLIPIDNSFLNLCLEALKKYENYDDMISLEDQRKIGEKTYQEFSHQEQKTNTHRKTIPPKKLLRYFIAAAVLLVALTATVAAVWNPFVSWLKERKLIDVKQGEVLENDNGRFTTDTKCASFSSIEEMEKQIGLHIDIFDYILVSPKSIILTTQGTETKIITQYSVNQKEVRLTIYLENAPYRQEAMEQAQIEKGTLWELEGYIIRHSGVQFIAFEDDYVYDISGNSLDTILQVMKG